MAENDINRRCPICSKRYKEIVKQDDVEVIFRCECGCEWIEYLHTGKKNGD